MSVSRAKPFVHIFSLSIFSVAWNAISWIVFFRAVSGPWRGEPPSFVPGLFVALFVLIGLGMNAAVVYMVLSLFNPHAPRFALQLFRVAPLAGQSIISPSGRSSSSIAQDG